MKEFRSRLDSLFMDVDKSDDDIRRFAYGYLTCLMDMKKATKVECRHVMRLLRECTPCVVMEELDKIIGD